MGSDKVQQEMGFRNLEAKKLFDWVKAGESASIVGMSGVGKSNLFNHLRDPQTQAMYLGATENRTIVIRANFHYVPDFADRSVYSLLLEQLEMLDLERFKIGTDVIEEINLLHEKLLDAGDDVLKVQRYFKQAVRMILGHSNRRLVILCDQFDEIYQEASPRLFANLRGLREAYKYRVSYFIFTRDLLTNLIELDAEREEFYELMASNLMGLKPYNEVDANLLLTRIAERNNMDVPNGVAEILYQLTGGHAGLLRATYLGVMEKGLSASLSELNIAPRLLKIPGINIECEKIWRSLSVRERRVLAQMMLDVAPAKTERPILIQLQRKGVLSEDSAMHLFSSLFGNYVGGQEALWERPLYFDIKARQVWVVGDAAPKLTPLEFKLLRLLYERAGEVVIKDELVQAGWPEAHGGVSDEALTAAISRLRKKIEPDPKNPRFLENVHNQGYVLKLDG